MEERIYVVTSGDERLYQIKVIGLGRFEKRELAWASSEGFVLLRTANVYCIRVPLRIFCSDKRFFGGNFGNMEQTDNGLPTWIMWLSLETITRDGDPTSKGGVINGNREVWTEPSTFEPTTTRDRWIFWSNHQGIKKVDERCLTWTTCLNQRLLLGIQRPRYRMWSDQK